MRRGWTNLLSGLGWEGDEKIYLTKWHSLELVDISNYKLYKDAKITALHVESSQSCFLYYTRLLISKLFSFILQGCELGRHCQPNYFPCDQACHEPYEMSCPGFHDPHSGLQVVSIRSRWKVNINLCPATFFFNFTLGPSFLPTCYLPEW